MCIIDTLENELCLDIKDKCPINYIKLSTKKPDGIKNLQQINGTSINFFFSNNPYGEDSTEKPYIQAFFKIADEKICCTLPYLYYSKLELYVLDPFKRKESYQCTLNDYEGIQKYTEDVSNKYHKLDNIKHYELYKENGFIDMIESHNLTYYGYDLNSLKEHNLHLYIRNFYGFDKECLKNREIDLTVERLNLIHSKADKQSLWSSIMISSCSNVIPSVLDFWSLNENKKIDLLKYVIWAYSSGALFFYTLYARDYDNFYEEEMNCSDCIANDNYNIMIYKIVNSGKTINVVFWVYLAIFIIDLLIFIKRLCMLCKSRDNESNDIEKNEIREQLKQS